LVEHTTENRGVPGSSPGLAIVVRAAAKKPYDLAVIGGGTAGLVSAFIAAGAGASVALVERERTGGDCLWTGCVPSKSLIASAQLAHRMRRADELGLPAVDPQIDFAAVMERVHAAIATIEPHDSPERLRAAGVEVVQEEARFVATSELEVGGRRLTFNAAIVATGSQPAMPAVPGLNGDRVLTTETVWDIRELPRRLVVLGGGPIGCELGQAFARLGSQVTLVQSADRLLGKEEPAASALVQEHFAAEGIDVRVRTRAVEARDGELTLESADRTTTVSFDRVLVATGRRPRTADLGLDIAGIDVDERGAVVVDDRLRTSGPRIYAAGDVTARLPFTHVAAHHARVATMNALFGTRGTVDETIPWVTFTDPEVARVGMTAAQARARWGDGVIVTRSEYADLDRAITESVPYGFALLVADPRGRLVGATVAAPGGGDAIAELTARVKAGGKLADLSKTVHAYPTLAEGPPRAADEYLRQRYSARRYRVLAASVLAIRRAAAAVR
jgi:pyruvate/2-oxoglutarate dehydrogenase complex dihydrolipoamide dehydrogenase (E3) component